MHPHEEPIVEVVGKPRRSKLHILRAFQLHRRVGKQWLKGDKRQRSRPTHQSVHAILGVAAGETEVHQARHRDCRQG